MSAKTIRVFEEERLKVGERGFTARAFEALARYAEGAGERFYALGHRSVRFGGYVGFLQIGELGIEVLPKADRASARAIHAEGEAAEAPWREALLGMLHLAGALKLHTPSAASLALRRADLLEIFLTSFLDEVEALLHEGLKRGYRQVEENRRSFRGKLVVAKQIRENHSNHGRFFVAHQAFDYDTPIHRVLREALLILERVVSSARLRGRARRIALLLPPISAAQHRAEELARLRARIANDRGYRRYLRAFELAELLILRFSPALRQGGTELLALLFSTAELWERSVARLVRALVLRDEAGALEVHAQARAGFFRAPRQPLRTLRPDLLIRERASGEVRLVIDTKWKRGEAGPSADDLKQAFAYNERFTSPRTVLLYPGSERGREPPARRVEGAFEARAHRCEQAYLHLTEAGRFSRRAMEEELRAILELAPVL